MSRGRDPQYPDPEGRDERGREQTRKPELYDFDANGPILTDEDQAILDRIWDRIRREREAKQNDD